MSTKTAEFRLAPGIAESTKVQQRFLSTFGQVALPLAKAEDLAVAVVFAGESHWLTFNLTCTCLKASFGRIPCFRPAGASLTCYSMKFPVVLEGSDNGEVVVCGKPGQQAIIQAFHSLIASASYQCSLERNMDSLITELTASWESLSAVYEISAFIQDKQMVEQVPTVLEHIINRATNGGPNLQAVLWLLNPAGDSLEPVAAKTSRILKTRSTGFGLLGKVIGSKQSLLLTSREDIRGCTELEAEFSKAVNLAVVPLRARKRELGAIALWSEDECAFFDTGTLRFLETLAVQSSMLLENNRLYQEILATERLHQEIEIGHTIQKTLLFSAPPANLSGVQVAARTLPSQMIDGDFYDFIVHNETCFDIVVGDVMGKGIPAALVGAATKDHFLRAHHELVNSSAQPAVNGPAAVVAEVHQKVVPQLIQLERFVTIHYGQFDLQHKRFTFVDCGHTQTVHFHYRTGICDLLEGDNLPIGVTHTEQYHQFEVGFEPGDVFFFYSDGITEARNPEGNFFGATRLVKIIRESFQNTTSGLIDEIFKELQAFAQNQVFADDLTCVAVKIGFDDWPSLRVNRVIELSSDLVELARVRAFVAELCAVQGFKEVAEEVEIQLKLALVELVTNLIKHGYQEEPGHQMTLEASRSGTQVVFELFHQGLPFDRAEVREPVFDGSQGHGFGLFIIESCLDEVVYGSLDEGKSFVRLVRNLD
ncbi:MAG: SpoIIE family protein phosphatase [Blastocatellia bacterium]|nr:SpoIIE family protein phosphatase [Blastocatellia bacterium]